MKYIYFILITLFSCNSSREDDKKLIQHNEELNHKNMEIIQLKRMNDSLKFELENCQLNYKALDHATE